MKLWVWPLGLLCCLLAAAGCAKRVPSPEPKFEAQQRVVLKFRGGEEIEGKIDTGRQVELREPGVVWLARVQNVTEDRIVLTGLVRVRDETGVALQVARAADPQFAISAPVPDKTLLRSEIVGVDLVKTDVSKTARYVTFWTYGAVVLALLLGERS